MSFWGKGDMGGFLLIDSGSPLVTPPILDKYEGCIVDIERLFQDQEARVDVPSSDVVVVRKSFVNREYRIEPRTLLLLNRVGRRTVS